jgi:hypothetical protein
VCAKNEASKLFNKKVPDPGWIAVKTKIQIFAVQNISDLVLKCIFLTKCVIS